MVTADPVAPGAAALAEAKAHLRIVGADEDALVLRLLASAAGLCEAFTGQVLIRRQFSELLPRNQIWQRLGRTPVAAITGVEEANVDGSAVAIGAADYAIDIDANGDGWVRVLRAGSGRVRVRYEAGMAADWGGVPEALRQGALRLAAHLYTHRAAAGDEGPPAAVTALWRPWRRMRLH